MSHHSIRGRLGKKHVFSPPSPLQKVGVQDKNRKTEDCMSALPSWCCGGGDGGGGALLVGHNTSHSEVCRRGQGWVGRWQIEKNNGSENKRCCWSLVSYMKFTEKFSPLPTGRIVSHSRVPPVFKPDQELPRQHSIQFPTSVCWQDKIDRCYQNTGKGQPPSGPFRGVGNPPRMWLHLLFDPLPPVLLWLCLTPLAAFCSTNPFLPSNLSLTPPDQSQFFFLIFQCLDNEFLKACIFWITEGENAYTVEKGRVLASYSSFYLLSLYLSWNLSFLFRMFALWILCEGQRVGN